MSKWNITKQEHIVGDHKLDITRRHFFENAFGKSVGFGIGSAALASLFTEEGFAQSAINHPLDFAPKAKHVIYLQQCGGPPHIDLFDFKPELVKRDGEPIPEMTRWAYRTLIALNKIRSERVRRAIGALIEDMVGSQ